jgi:hypothetical protein
MANGTLKDEATYFNDKTKYTGNSGSYTNMWVIEDVYDFVKVVDDTGGCARIVNDIDFNDHSTYKRGISNKSLYGPSLRTTEIYGDGHKIYNMVCIGTTKIWIYYIENCDFVNMCLVDTSQFPIRLMWQSNSMEYEDGTMLNCDFGIVLSNSSLGFRSYGRTTISDCTFNVKGKTGADYLIDGCQCDFQCCHFNFDVSIAFNGNGNSVFESSGQTASSMGTYTNCYFTGRISASRVYNMYFSFYNSFTNCYFGLEWVGVGYSYNTYSYDKFSGCFVDKELFNKNGDNWQSISGVSELTTQQALDSDYLNSIGYLVIRVKRENNS